MAARKGARRGLCLMQNEEKLYHVIVSDHASCRMHKHYDFLGQVSESAAEKLVNKLSDDIASLNFMPQRNPRFYNAHMDGEEYRWMLSAKRYRIIYTIAGDTVFVDDIQDCRQNDSV